MNTIRRNFYVDDCLKSVPDEKQALELSTQLRNVCSTDGFKLIKWMSTSRSVLSMMPDEDKAKEVRELDLDQEHLPIERALGIKWNVETDTFFFKTSLKYQPLTKRGILSVTNSIYDPIGFLAPVILPAKKIIQDLCRIDCGWDEKIPESFAHSWQEWLDSLPKISQINIKRCLKPDNFGELQTAQLHHFCDASESGYGTVTYIRLTNLRGDIHVSFVLGKSRVAPIKQMTIPRLELTAAVVAVRLDRMLQNELEIEG